MHEVIESQQLSKPAVAWSSRVRNGNNKKHNATNRCSLNSMIGLRNLALGMYTSVHKVRTDLFYW